MTNFQITTGAELPLTKGDLFVFREYGYSTGQATSVTAYRVTFGGGRWIPRDGVVYVGTEAKTVAAQLNNLRVVHDIETRNLSTKHRNEVHAIIKQFQEGKFK